MIPVSTFAGRPVAVMGLGLSGLAAARALGAGGAEVRAWDDSAETRAAAADAGIALTDLLDSDWSDIAVLILSPGIPHTYPAPHPVAEQARVAGCEILCDVDLLGRAQPDARYLGITGTNGKSTVTALLGHILQSAGVTAEAGGNLGIPALELRALDRAGWYVLEMSSYQLERTHSIVFDIAVLLNISPDHLDRHGGLDGYIAAKRNIFRGQDQQDVAIIGVDDPHTRAIHDTLTEAGRARIVPVSAERAVTGGISAVDGALIDDMDGTAARITDLGGISTLPGRHNWQNAAAAYAAARAVGIAPDRIAAALASYPGLPHRQQRLAVIDGVSYVNDSKATNLDAAARALDSYETIYWIAGGRAKSDDLSALAPWFGRIRHAFLIGEAATGFAAALDGAVPTSLSGDLATAVTSAHALATAETHPDAVVLLSPACASFDQFPNFEARGEAFAELVAGLPGKRDESGETVH